MAPFAHLNGGATDIVRADVVLHPDNFSRDSTGNGVKKGRRIETENDGVIDS